MGWGIAILAAAVLLLVAVCGMNAEIDAPLDFQHSCYKVTAHRSSGRRMDHLENGSTDQFEGN